MDKSVVIFLKNKLKLHTNIADTARSANSVHVFIDIGWQVVVYHMLHIRDIKPSRCHL